MNKIKYYFSEFRKLNNKQKCVLMQKLALSLFPTPRAFVNFILIFPFLTILTWKDKTLLVTLVSALGTVYCLNEWSKEVNKNG